ncbi:uncharacterized protein [Miscanthus floridulus]|uniref:uncharacterized protein n=1 Tax=Miscanthus floridulus TaxID=154761 RepID=UPI003458BCFB
MAIKSQVLANFIIEWSEVQMPPAVVGQEYWMMYFDGSLMKKGVGMGLVFVLPLGLCMRYMVHIHFPSNNVAEYEAHVNGLRIAIDLGIRWLNIQGDSQLVIDQVMKESSYNNAKIAAYCQEVRQLEDKFNGLKLNHIPRCLNEVADTLAKVASGRELVPMSIFASNQYKPSVYYEELEQTSDAPPALGSGANRPLAPSNPEVMELDEDLAIELDPLSDWRMPYLDYLLHEALPIDKIEARWLRRRAKFFILTRG